MCGIYGFVSLFGDKTPDRSLLKRMGDSIVHRGPDDSGDYVSKGIGLGMRRLSIIDLSGGHQPLTDYDETLWLVCNGEIYNFKELRKELEAKGHIFKTGSDSEVIIYLYKEYGDSFVEYLNGMYVFAIWDSTRQKLILGRDRLGIKPLYYYSDGQCLIFASEAKAILQAPQVGVDFDPVALEAYLALGYVPAPYSIFSGIKKLPPASLLNVEKSAVTIQCYWNFPKNTDYSRSEADWAATIRAKLESVVQSQMVSDVPIGAFLSGGIDSSAVVAFMARHSSAPINTYSIGFNGDKAGSYYNELPYAQQIAKHFRTNHREIIVKPDVVKLLPRLLWHMDEPIADTAFVTTYLVAEFARDDVKVILSGVGGDELFGGYRRYLGDHYIRQYQRLPHWFRREILHKLVKYLPNDRHSALKNFFRYARSFILSAELTPQERYRSYVEVFSSEIRSQLLNTAPPQTYDALSEAFSIADESDTLRYLFEVDCRTQLPDDLLLLTDKMTMATSLECRVPFLDHELVELSSLIPSTRKIVKSELKHMLKQSLVDILPKEILYRKKRGFGAPIGAWLKHDLSPLLRNLLSKEAVERRSLFRWQTVHRTIEMHMANHEDNTDHLLSLINLELWFRLYVDNRTPDDIASELSASIN